MFQQWLSSLKINNDTDRELDPYWIERVTALLLVEIARADSQIDQAELLSVKRAIEASCTSIKPEEMEEIIATAQKEAEASVSFHSHVRQINSGFNRQQKLQLIEQMWRVAYADCDLDKYEEYTIRKLSNLLHLGHSEFMQAKLRVIEG